MKLANGIIVVERTRRIGIVSPKIYPVLKESAIDAFGGAEVALSMVARELSNRADFDVRVLVGDYGQEDIERLGKMTLHRALDSRAGLFRNALRLLSTIKSADARIYIQRTLDVASTIIALYCRLSGRRFVYWVAHDSETDGTHELYKRWPTALLVNIMYKVASHVVVQNFYEWNQLKKKKPDIQCTLIKKGIDLTAQESRPRAHIDAIWVGRCDEWKNPEAFIELAGAFEDRRFVMICPPAEGKDTYHREVLSQAEALPNLEFRGRIANKEVLDLVSRSRIFCITSSQEGDWPNVVLEAASLCTPVLSLAINYDSLIDDFAGGRFCHGSNARLIEEFHSMIFDPDMLSRMGKGAHDYVRETHDVHEETRKLIGLLNDLY